jgi:hypothetical protein
MTSSPAFYFHSLSSLIAHRTAEVCAGSTYWTFVLNPALALTIFDLSDSFDCILRQQFQSDSQTSKSKITVFQSAVSMRFTLAVKSAYALLRLELQFHANGCSSYNYSLARHSSIQACTTVGLCGKFISLNNSLYWRFSLSSRIQI